MDTTTTASTIALLCAIGAAFVWLFRAMSAFILTVFSEIKPYLENWLEIQREKAQAERQRAEQSAGVAESVQRIELVQEKIRTDVCKIVSSQRMLLELWAKESPHNGQLYEAARSVLADKREGD